jgi:glycosyltransferase involved in cell wall biosynthesis
MYRDNVDCFVPPSEFVSNRLVEAGFSAQKVCVIPNMVAIPHPSPANGSGDYVGYAGRLTAEKGIDVFLQSAVKTKLPVRLAGAFVNEMKWSQFASQEIVFLGALPRHELRSFYGNARFVVVPSVCQEAFGLVAAEAMAHGRPVIASRVGGLQEVIEDGVSGFLVTPGNTDELSEKMDFLWRNPDTCLKMGAAARQRAIDRFSREAYYPRLIRAYGVAVERAQARQQL